MKSLSLLDFVALIIVVISGLNMGLIGLFHLDLIAAILGSDMSLLAKVIDVTIGVAAIYVLILALKMKGILKN